VQLFRTLLDSEIDHLIDSIYANKSFKNTDRIILVKTLLKDTTLTKPLNAFHAQKIINDLDQLGKVEYIKHIKNLTDIDESLTLNTIDYEHEPNNIDNYDTNTIATNVSDKSDTENEGGNDKCSIM
jgi:hypothetical protein